MNLSLEKYIERLNELINIKKALLLDILALTADQSGVIEEDSLDTLGNLIEEKQRKIDEINKLDEEFDTYFLRLKSVLGISRLDRLDASKLEGSACSGAKQLKAVTAEILDIIQRIGALEKENEDKSKRLLGTFGDEIKKINQGKKVNHAYAPGLNKTTSYFIDKKK